MDGWYVDTKHFFRGFHVPQLFNPNSIGSLVALTIIILFLEMLKFRKIKKLKKRMFQGILFFEMKIPKLINCSRRQV